MSTTQHAAGVDYVLNLEDIDATQLALAGGKGASLGELSRVEGVRVPPGFCVTADAFRRIVAPAIEDRLDRLSLLDPDDRDGDPHAERGDPPGHRSDRDPPRSGDGDHRPARRAGRLRGAVERDGGGPADGLVRGPAGLVSERRRAGRDPRARQPLLGLAVHRAGGDLPHPERLRPPQGADGRRRAADGRRRTRPASSSPRTRSRPTATSPRWRRSSASARRWSQARSTPIATRCGTARSSRKEIAGEQAGADRCAGHRARAARPADRGALRPPAGHRVVPRRRRVPDRPEPADHHAVPHPRER